MKEIVIALSPEADENLLQKFLRNVKGVVDIKVRNKPSEEEVIDLTDKICEGLKEVKLIQEGKLKGYTLEEALNEI